MINISRLAMAITEDMTVTEAIAVITTDETYVRQLGDIDVKTRTRDIAWLIAAEEAEISGTDVSAWVVDAQFAVTMEIRAIISRPGGNGQREILSRMVRMRYEGMDSDEAEVLVFLGSDIKMIIDRVLTSEIPANDQDALADIFTDFYEGNNDITVQVYFH